MNVSACGRILGGILWLISSVHSMEDSPPILFPAEKEKLIAQINSGVSNIHIYIPANQKDVDFPPYAPADLALIKRLTIEHSARGDRGYFPGVQALIPLVKAPNLEEIILSHLLADELLPHIRAGILVFLNCGCFYRPTDTIYPEEDLRELRANLLQYYKERYPEEEGYRISALEVENTLKTLFAFLIPPEKAGSEVES